MSNTPEKPQPTPPQIAAAKSTVRAITLNLWGDGGPWERRLALCARQLGELAPDVIALQEVRQQPGKVPNTAETLARELGMQHVFAKTVEWGGGDEGLAILSRFPIRDSGQRPLPHPMPKEADERFVLWALLDAGAAGTIAAFTTHLTYRMTHGILREDQAAAVDEIVQELICKQPERPAVTLVMGDFNASPDADELRFMRGLHTLSFQGQAKPRRTYYQDAFLVQRESDGTSGITWARRNLFTHKLRFLETDRRIDYIFVGQASRDGRGLVHSCRVVLDQPDAGNVFPSDHFAVMADVQLTPIV